MTELDFLARLAVGVAAGALIGLERQWRQRGAGLRTNVLVATGACLFVLLSVAMDDDTSPTRVAAQVVSGVGFLGAGVIMRDGVNVRGANVALRPIAYRIDRQPVSTRTEVETSYRFRAVCRHASEAHIRALILQSLAGFRLQSLHSEDLDEDRVAVNADLLVEGRPDGRLEQAVSRLSLEPGVTAVRWEILGPEATEVSL